MEPVQITPEASSDIAKLAQGRNRVDVALEALKGANLNEKQVEQLRALLGTAAPAVDAATVPASKTVPPITIEHMKAALRAEDCLYDKAEIWTALRAKEVPEIPEAVIKEAYEKGGRVILRCSSISEKAEALRAANRSVSFWGSAEQSDYQNSVSKPEWIVVPSHIDRSTRGSPKSKVVTSEMPAPTPEDWFSVIAYARLEGGRQPKGCEGLYAFTTETGTVVGSYGDGIGVDRDGYYDRSGHNDIGAARFGPPRN